MPEPKDHAQNRNFVETVLRKIPGFRGYLEKEYRRESDQLQRTWLVDRLQRSKRAIDEMARPLADQGQIDLLPQVDRIRGDLDRLIGRIRGAMHGYSGFFDLVRIGEAELDRVYEHDLALMAQVEELAGAVESLPGRTDRLAEALSEVSGRVAAVEQQWDAREDILKGLD
jgi:hypothetical protein